MYQTFRFQRVVLLGAAIGTAGLVFAAPQCCARALQQGLALCGGPLLVSLFPFLIVSALLMRCGAGQVLGFVFRPVARLIGVRSPAAGGVLLIGFLGGFAPAAAAVAEAVRSRELTPQEASALLPACICSGPSFVILTAGEQLLGSRVLGIVNVVGSSIAREADNVFYTLAGPEIAVATTKAYSTQLIAGYCLAVQFALVRGCISQGRYQDLISQLQCLPEQIQKILDDKERIQWFAAKQANARDVFFIGRGLDYAISLEGSLKMKEISYIHSEAYAAGELKHGTISLIEDGTLVIGVLTQSELYEKTISNMVECKSRGAYLMGLTTYGNYNIEDTASFTVYVPKTEECFATSLAVIPLQLMGYYVSVAKGLDVDKPRNLAKSVTVE